jgi:hypothetical protein
VRRAAIYLVVVAIGHLLWEAAQLPLYTIWWHGTAREITVAVVHCTGGDALISAATLLIAGIMAWLCGWSLFGWRMAATAIVLGVGYTIMSEWVNVAVWRSWSYSSAMPVLPWLGTGLSPLLQWFLVPAVAFGIAACSRKGGPTTGSRKACLIGGRGPA